MNDLSIRLIKLHISCSYSDIIIDDLRSAVDIVLIAPSVKGMRTLVNTCSEYGNEFDIKCSALKSKDI